MARNMRAGGGLQRHWLVLGMLLSALIGAGCSSSSGGSSGSGDGGDAPVPRGDRLLGFDALDTAEGGSFEDNMEQIARCGADFIALHLTWSQIEPTAESYEDPFDALASLALVCAARDLQLSLTVRPIDLTGKTVPADLESMRFNDPVMIARFQAVIDFVLSRFPAERLVSLQIGNEIDGYDTSAEPATFWNDYAAFLAACTAHAHAVAPDLRIGFTAMLDGVVQERDLDHAIVSHLAAQVDVVGLTYYPIDGGFQVEPLARVAADLAAAVALFDGRPILLQEVGCPSSAACASSDTRQAEFIRAFFAAWDQHAQAITAVNFLRLIDLSDAHTAEMAALYGIDDVAFLGYLQTLGLRHASGSGSDKPAFEALIDAAMDRGWVTTSN